MAFVPVPDTVMVEMLYTWDGQQCENTLYFRNAGGWTTTEINALGALIEASHAANMAPNQANTVSLNTIRITDLSSNIAPVIDFTTGLPNVGSNASPSLPNNVSMAVRFNTANRGRSYRGRNYVIGLAESGVAGNVVSSSTVTAWVAAYSDIISDAAAAGFEAVVVSRFTNNAPRVTGVATPITSVSAENIVDSQRRRLPGRGR